VTRAVVALLILPVICGVVAYAGRAEPFAHQSPYAAWSHGPSPDPKFFPLAVWLQDPKHAPAYRALGINTYVGLWEGPTEEQLAALRRAGMFVICDQNQAGLRHRDEPIIIGWMHGDEPDNAQPLPGGGYGPAIPTQRIIADYQEMRRNDPTRPVLLNLGQGVAYDEWKGIGCTLLDYPEYVKGCDLVSFDIYPVVHPDLPDGENWLWLVAKGVDRLRQWTQGRKVIWNALECTHISRPDRKATPAQVKAEVWMSLVHGSLGIIYFVHQFQPEEIEAGLLADPEMSAAVKAINQQILALAPVLNSPTIENAAGVMTSNPNVPIDIMVKRQGSDIYLFAVAMRNAATHGSFKLEVLRRTWGEGENGAVEVIGEGRTIPMWGGRFEDDFEPYAVHLYRVAAPSAGPRAAHAQ